MWSRAGPFTMLLIQTRTGYINIWILLYYVAFLCKYREFFRFSHGFLSHSGLSYLKTNFYFSLNSFIWFFHVSFLFQLLCNSYIEYLFNQPSILFSLSEILSTFSFLFTFFLPQPVYTMKFFPTYRLYFTLTMRL